MAEALTTAKWGHQLSAYSAGVKPGPRVDPLAVKVLAELGIDHSSAYPKSVHDAEALFGRRRCALVVTVCDNAALDCPFYANTDAFVHTPFPDPPKLAAAAGPEVDPLPFYRSVRDEIAVFVDDLPRLIPSLRGAPRQLARPQASSASGGGDKPPAIGFFEKWLSLWVALCMVVGALIGYYAEGAASALANVEFAGINAIIAVLLWILLFPMFATLDFSSLAKVKDAPAALLLTCTLSYAVKPFTMWGLALLFFRVFYVHVIPDVELQDSIIAGLVLLAGAPCTAMVFVWSTLMAGDTAYTLTQVAVNDLLMLALYVPICGLLIGTSNIALPWVTIAVALALFIGAPLALAAIVRAVVLYFRDERFLLDKVVGPIKPLTMVALLAVLVLIFVFQGATIGDRAGVVFAIAVPILIQCALLFAICYGVSFATCIPHSRAGPASLIATSNFFELAVAVAVSIYGPGSGAALATVVGVLIEVPVMLSVNVCNHLKPRLDKRCDACDTVCPQYNEAGARLAKALRCGKGDEQELLGLTTK